MSCPIRLLSFLANKSGIVPFRSGMSGLAPLSRSIFISSGSSIPGPLNVFCARHKNLRLIQFCSGRIFLFLARTMTKIQNPVTPHRDIVWIKNGRRFQQSYKPIDFCRPFVDSSRVFDRKQRHNHLSIRSKQPLKRQ